MSDRIYVRLSLRFSGILLVLRQRVRRTVRRDLVGMTGLLTLLLGISALLETQPPLAIHRGGVEPGVPFWVGTGFYLASVSDFPLRWLMIYLFLASLALLPLSALLGARAMPERVEARATQEALLTHLSAHEITLARLLANLAPVLGALAISLLFWLLMGFLHRPADSYLARGGYEVGAVAIVGVHLVLVCAVFMVAAVGALFASRIESAEGAWWGRGALGGLALAVFCLGGILILDRALQRLDNPVPWINGLLLLNPVAAIASLLRVDLLRVEWLYEHTQANEYPFSYPNPLLSALIYAGIGGIGAWGAGMRLHLAYHEGRRSFQGGKSGVERE